MKNAAQSPENLSIAFERNDIILLAEMAEILSKVHPSHKWPLKRVVYLAVGNLYRQLTGANEVTAGEFVFIC